MARSKNNILLKGSTGKLGKLIFKQYSYGTVVSKSPDRSNVKLSKKQKQANKRFQEAVKFAKSISAESTQYEEYKKLVNRGKSLSVYHAALKDYLKRNAVQ